MSYNSICPIYKKNSANTAHHLYSKTKAAKKKYGELIHHPNNIMYVCLSCHLWKTMPKISEEEFRIKVGLEGEL